MQAQICERPVGSKLLHVCFHCMFTICSLYVHYILTIYSLYMFTICSLYITYKYTICSLYVYMITSSAWCHSSISCKVLKVFPILFSHRFLCTKNGHIYLNTTIRIIFPLQAPNVEPTSRMRTITDCTMDPKYTLRDS